MTVLALYGGPTKGQMIDRAFGLCGQSTTQFSLSAEEYELGLMAMNDLAATIGEGFGYNFPEPGSIGAPGDESGILGIDVLGFTAMLAQEIAPNIGKAWAPNGTQGRAKSELLARYQIVPTMSLGRATIRGAGNKRRSAWFGPFFYAPGTGDEPAQ